MDIKVDTDNEESLLINGKQRWELLQKTAVIQVNTNQMRRGRRWLHKYLGDNYHIITLHTGRKHYLWLSVFCFFSTRLISQWRMLENPIVGFISPTLPFPSFSCFSSSSSSSHSLISAVPLFTPSSFPRHFFSPPPLHLFLLRIDPACVRACVRAS